jgi:hypothetical protein
MYVGRPTTIRHLFSSAPAADENSNYFRGPLYLRRPTHENNFYFRRPKSGRRKYNDPNPADTLDSIPFCPKSPPLAAARSSPRPSPRQPTVRRPRRARSSATPARSPPLAVAARRPLLTGSRAAEHARPFTAPHRGQPAVSRPRRARSSLARRGQPAVRHPSSRPLLTGSPRARPPFAAPRREHAAVHRPSPRACRPPPLAAPAPHRSIEFEPAQAPDTRRRRPSTSAPVWSPCD